MRRPVLLYLVMLIAYLVIDSVWLTFTSNALYRATLNDILLPGFHLAPAIAVYFLQVLGLVVFVMPRAIASGRGITALFYGAAFGLFTYGLYDLTNDATLRHWTLPLNPDRHELGCGGVRVGLADWLDLRPPLRTPTHFLIIFAPDRRASTQPEYARDQPSPCGRSNASLSSNRCNFSTCIQE